MTPTTPSELKTSNDLRGGDMVATDIGWRPVVWTKRVPGNVEVCIRVHQGKRTTYCSGEQDISYWYTPSDVFEVRR